MSACLSCIRSPCRPQWSSVWHTRNLKVSVGPVWDILSLQIQRRRKRGAVVKVKHAQHRNYLQRSFRSLSGHETDDRSYRSACPLAACPCILLITQEHDGTGSPIINHSQHKSCQNSGRLDRKQLSGFQKNHEKISSKKSFKLVRIELCWPYNSTNRATGTRMKTTGSVFEECYQKRSLRVPYSRW